MIQKQSPNPQIHILALGDNNLRWFYDDPIDVLLLLRDFLMEARKIENCHVMVCSLLPSIENQENCNRAFLQFDRSLKIIADPQFEIIKLQKRFRNKTQ